MSGVGAIIAGILLSFGVGFGFLAAMTAFGESRKHARKRRERHRGRVAAPVMVLLVLTGICVAVSRPIDWLTGGL